MIQNDEMNDLQVLSEEELDNVTGGGGGAAVKAKDPNSKWLK